MLIAVGIHLEDYEVLNQSIDGSDGHRGIWEDLIPGAEWLVDGDHDRSSLVAGTDKLEQHRSLGLVLLEIGEIVEDDEVIYVELLDSVGSFAVIDLDARTSFAYVMNALASPLWDARALGLVIAMWQALELA